MVLALSVGDPSGIGPDVALLAFARRKELALPAFLLIADTAQIAARAKLLGLDLALRECGAGDAARTFERALPVLSLHNHHRETPGVPTIENAAGTIEAIDRAVEMVASGDAAAVVTCPIAKKPLYDAGFRFPGHTEYLAHLAAQKGTAAPLAVMMLAGPLLRTVPVTIHIPLRAVATCLTTALIIETARIVDREKIVADAEHGDGAPTRLYGDRLHEIRCAHLGGGIDERAVGVTRPASLGPRGWRTHDDLMARTGE